MENKQHVLSEAEMAGLAINPEVARQALEQGHAQHVFEVLELLGSSRLRHVQLAGGAGVAEAILGALESAARERGWSRLVLETGLEQRAAVRFYERAGFHEIPRFGYYVDAELSVCFEKSLAAR